MRLRCWRGLDDKCSTLKSTGSTSETLGKTRLQPTFTLLFLIDNKLLSQVYVFFFQTFDKEEISENRIKIYIWIIEVLIVS